MTQPTLTDPAQSVQSPVGEPPPPENTPAPPEDETQQTEPVSRSRSSYVMPFEHPPYRRLRAYAFDPSLAIELEHAVINEVTINVAWEYDARLHADVLHPGPVGEYVEVVDYDPASKCFYAPVNLNDPWLLARDGLDPSEGNPQFHQQMVYAVAMRTIRNFELALGRLAFWAPRRIPVHDGQGRQRYSPDGEPEYTEEYVRRLRIYPHALREENAYYSPHQVALLFGYFPAAAADPRHHLPGGTVFTCLSHDIVAHETTHALLDGLHRYFDEPTNVDSLAFHEAFADIVALFQHFSYPEVLRHQIARTRGNLHNETLLAKLAQQFGKASGSHGALRDALGGFKPGSDEWVRSEADPQRIRTETQPHARGALLVAAIFDAFVAIYRTRTADLVRIATSGTGVLPEGSLHPDLVGRLAQEAAKAAQHLLSMCIRALDYCPPVDLDFGDYLRALITADVDLVPDDDLNYRTAIIESFRRRGIYPHNVRSLAVDSLRWNELSEPLLPEDMPGRVDIFRRLRMEMEEWSLRSNRGNAHNRMNMLRDEFHHVLQRELSPPGGKSITRPGWPEQCLRIERATGLDLHTPHLPFEVHAIRPARRIGPDGQSLTDLVVEITQWRPGYFDPRKQAEADRALARGERRPQTDFDFHFRGGCTLLIDPERMRARYVAFKPLWTPPSGEVPDIWREPERLPDAAQLWAEPGRMAEQRRYLSGQSDGSLRATYWGNPMSQAQGNPYVLLHRMAGEEDFL